MLVLPDMLRFQTPDITAEKKHVVFAEKSVMRVLEVESDNAVESGDTAAESGDAAPGPVDSSILGDGPVDTLVRDGPSPVTRVVHALCMYMQKNRKMNGHKIKEIIAQVDDKVDLKAVLERVQVLEARLEKSSISILPSTTRLGKPFVVALQFFVKVLKAMVEEQEK